MIKSCVYVTLKEGVLDPQGQAIENAFHHMQIANIHSIRQGKYFEIVLKTDHKEEAKLLVEKMCRQLLANTVIENYRYELLSDI